MQSKKQSFFGGKGVWAGKIKIYNVIKNFKIIFFEKRNHRNAP